MSGAIPNNRCLADPFKVFNEQLFARDEPSDPAASEGHSRPRAANHDQTPGRGTQNDLVEVVYLITEVMQTTTALEKFLDG